MQHRLILFGVTLLAIAALGMSVSAQPHAIPLTLTNDTLTFPPLYFGIIPGADPCIDTTDHYLTYRELELPPLPDPTWQILSGRFIGNPNLAISPCFEQGTPHDFRPVVAPGQKDTFYVHVQDGEPGWPVTVKWPSGLGSKATSLRLVDVLTYGGIVNVNMLVDTSYAIPFATFEQFAIIMEPVIVVTGTEFLSLTTTQVFDENPLKPGKSNKAVKRAKLGKPVDPVKNVPNWSTLLADIVIRGGFAPNTSESDEAGGMVIGTSYMFLAGPNKWKPVKEQAAVRCWIRMSKWDFKKSVGKGWAEFQKTLRSKEFNHTTGLPRGFDSTGVPGDLKRKPLVKQLKKLDPKKTPNRLFAELVALKVNIVASALGTTPAGFGELIFDRNGHPYDEWPVKNISRHLDSAMTLWETIGPNGGGEWDSAYTAVSLINVAFVGQLDTLQFNAYSGETALPLIVDGQVPIGAVPYLKLPTPFIPTRITPASDIVELDEEDEWEDLDPEEVDGVPVAMTVMQNFPNPFNPTTTIAFLLAEDANVSVTIYDMLGREVATLVEGEEFEGGMQTVEFTADNLASGVYFYRVTGENVETGAQLAPAIGKMMLLK